MSPPKMHTDEVEVDAALVGRLLARQFPQWAGLSLRPVPSFGTDHHIYRLGDDLAVRLPRIGWATGQAATARTSGCTATSYRATSSSPAAGSRRSSTSAA